MKISTIVRLGFLLLLVIGLMGWATTLSANGEPPATVSVIGQTKIDPCLTFFLYQHSAGIAILNNVATSSSPATGSGAVFSCSSSSSSSSSSSVAIFANRVAPKTSTTIGSSGGSLDSPGGDGTVTAPAGSVPAGGQLTISQPNENGLPRGTFVLRGDGDHWDAVSVTDANGNPVYPFAPPGLTFCFNLSASEVANANGPLTIQMWDGGKWVDVVFTFTVGTPNKLCTTFTGL